MAHTKSQKAAKGNRDSRPKMLGVKLYGGQEARSGNIIVRQRGMTFTTGTNTYVSKDFSIHATTDGIVQFKKRRGKTSISVMPS